MNASVTQTYSLEHLLAELRRITQVVTLRFLHMREENSAAVEDEFRGLYVSEDEVAALLADPELFLSKGYPAELQASELTPEMLATAGTPRLEQLKATFSLSSFELDVLLIALAPELELRYERLYAYLQDDVTRRRPSIDLALRLLCPGLAAQLAARRSFDADSPLLRYRLIELSDDSKSVTPSLLGRVIKIDEGLVAWLLGENRLDLRLRTLADIDEAARPEHPLLFGESSQSLPRLVEMANNGFICGLVGTDEASKRYFAGELARQTEAPLLVMDVALLPGLPRAEHVLRILERELHLHRAVLYLSNYESLNRPAQAETPRDDANVLEARRFLNRLLNSFKKVIFISSSEPLAPGIGGAARRQFSVIINLPEYSERQRLWEQYLGKSALGLDLEGLASRYRLSSGQIMSAAETARHFAAWRGETTPTLSDLENAARTHSSQRLGGLARKLNPTYRWDDLVLPHDQTNMLREICLQVKHRSLVYGKWGFDKKISLGKGLNVIFAGPSGTGKTMSAEIIASELRMDVYKIDLSSMVSKYIGETEKNLERVFTEAGESNAILFFDEADSLFGKRSEVKDAHDRYANIETGYLLQKLEEYDGIVILATNLRKNLDEAFIRRIHFIIEYPFPEEEDRLLIWQKVFPKATPLNDDFDLRFMARQFKLAGGNIKNIALAAAFMAAEQSRAVNMADLIKSTRREYQKLGKLCTQSDFAQYFYLVEEADPKVHRRNGVAGSAPKV